MNNKEIPSISIKEDTITIHISAEDLKWIAEHKPDSSYKIIDSIKFLKEFAFQLENFQHSNAIELGMSELQYLFDEIIDEVYQNASDAIIDTEEGK